MTPKIPDYRSKVGATLEEICSFTIDIAEQVGALAKHEREITKIGYTMKAPKQMVTVADKKVELRIMDSILKLSENDNFYAEEGANQASRRLFTDPSWIIDPIDGTTNYASYLNHVGISIAYAEQGVVQVAVVHMPFTGETFSAIKGKGAFLNGDKIVCPNDKPMSESLIAFGAPKEGDKECAKHFGNVYLEVLSSCFGMRRLGAASADIAYIAAGRLHGYFESVKPWDIAAACLIAKEAGATVGHFLPLPETLPVPEDMYSEGVLVAAPNIFQEFKEMVQRGFGVK